MDILYSDKYIVVCQKPAELSSQEDGSENCLPALLRKTEETDYIAAVHRLDQGVSGLMVFAKNKFAAGELSRQITEGSFTKTYYAVVCGIPDPPLGEMKDLLFHDGTKNKSYVVRRFRRGVRDAALEYELIKSGSSCGKKVSLVKIRLITGRTHQIRVQFSSRSMPLLGDRKYGGTPASRIYLISAGLSFYHPKTGELLCFELPVPEDFAERLKND